MAEYKVPLKDMSFLLYEVFQADKMWQKLPKLAQQVDKETAQAILQECAKIAEQELDPIARQGDEIGVSFKDGVVTTAPGYKEAFNTYVEGGWTSLGGDVNYGGMGMPKMLTALHEEMLCSADISFALYPVLTAGAALSLAKHGSEALKQRYLTRMYSGEWSASMCLTEAHSGSDLGIIRTKAIPQEDGTYNVTGTKIFITGGEHDLTENIVHLVLAKLPDAPAGPRGISLFLVPKYQVNDDETLGEFNNVSCGSIEHKMGIHASATCVMNFDGAKGYLISEPHKGMSAMFTFINESRLGVAMHGQAHSEVSFQKSLIYAKDRVQFRVKPRVTPEKNADPIISHPDVRRMLLTQKAIAEGGRMLNMFCGQMVDIEQSPDFSEAEHAEAGAMLAVLTPIAKGFLSETSQETTNYGIQVLGGHGFIKEWGMEQEVRDARISQLYEGTTGIQGLDLLGRKILGSKGKVLKPMMAKVEKFIKENKRNKFAKQLKGYVSSWESLTRSIGFSAMRNTDEVNAAAVDYLMFAGYVTVAYFWAEAAVAAEKALSNGAPEPEFYKSKIATADFYYQRIMPRTLSHEAAIKNGMDSMMEIAPENFAFL